MENGREQGMAKITISKSGAGIPPTRRSRQATCPDCGRTFTEAGRWQHTESTLHRAAKVRLEAVTVFTDGRAYTEKVEEDTPTGREAMDRWAFRRTYDPGVDYVKVERVTGRIAGYGEEPMMRRNNSAATARRLEREHRQRDENDDPATMTDNDLWSSIYRLQGRRDPAMADRLAVLVGEQARRGYERSR